jgi:hypothetical protein
LDDYKLMTAMLLAILSNTSGPMSVSVRFQPGTILRPSIIHYSDYMSWTEGMIALVSKILVSKSYLFLK